MAAQNHFQKQWLAAFIANKRLKRRYLLAVAAILNVEHRKETRTNLAAALARHISQHEVNIEQILSMPGARYLAIAETLRACGINPAHSKDQMIKQVLALGRDRNVLVTSNTSVRTTEYSGAPRTERGEKILDNLMGSLK